MSSEPTYDWNAKLVRFFVSNPRLVWLLLIAVILGGWISLLNMQREGFPQVSPKIVFVQTIYPGASAQEVEGKVTKEIEDSLKDVKGLQDISSVSQNSFSNVTVILDEKVNGDQALQDIQSKVQSVRSTLPTDAEQSKVSTIAISGPSFIYGVTGGTDQTANRAEAEKLITALSAVNGVKSAKLVDEQTDRVVVSYRLADLQAKGVTLTALQQVLQAANFTIPLDNLDIENQEQSVVSTGSFSDLDQIRNTALGFNPVTRQPVLVKDVASVSIAPKNTEQISRFGYRSGGKTISATGVLFSVELTQDTDVISAKAKIDASLNKNKSLTVVILADQAESTANQVNEIISAALGSKSNFWLLGGIQLLFLAILLFVNVRAALIAALAIPLSLGVTFITLGLLGVQLNTIVLFSLILVLGLIVDPAIVMVEAIQRYRDLHYDRRESVLESGRRYGASLFMAVLTSLIVFFPFGVVSGIFGQIIKYIPLTVIPALVASYFVPMALLPLLAERLLKTRSLVEKTHTEAETAELSKPATFVMRVNRWILDSRWRQIGVLLVSLVLVILSLSLVPLGKVQIVQFSTPQDNQFLSVTAALAKGQTFTQRDLVGKQIEDAILSEPAVEQFSYQTQDHNSLVLFVRLLDKKDRPKTTDSSKAIMSRLKDKIATLGGLTDSSVAELAIGPPTSLWQIQTQLYSNNSATLEKAAKTIGTFLSQQEHVIKVDDGYTDRGEPQVQIILDRTKVEKVGLSSAEVGLQLKSLTSETQITKFDDPQTGESQDVVMVNGSTPARLDDIRNLPLVSRAGLTLKVSDIATVQEGSTVDAIQRFDGARYVTVQARVDKDTNTLAVQKKLNDYLTDSKIKELGLDSQANRGDATGISKSFKELGIALAVAVLLTYLVLVLQFKSFSQPVIMLFTIPLSLIGVFPALWATNSNLGFLELLGVTILVGIVENVAIFLIDYSNQQMKEQNLSAKEAIILASGVRFRPILLTKLVALGGLLPLAIESEFWRGLAVVIIAGIGLSGFFSLVVIPIMFVWIAKIRSRIHGGSVRLKKA